MGKQSKINTAVVYNFWKLVDEYHLRFPRIQRDYAQGRKTFKAKQVRESFLKNLHEALKEDCPRINLDFVYGVQKKDGNKIYFSPLDGQQRLTTLFLLYWFLAYKSNNYETFLSHLSENNNDEVNKDEVKFLYETRDSAKEFCKKLILNTPNSFIEGKSISWNIKNQNWFLSMWIEDPTVEGMLTMLDAMDDEFRNDNSISCYFDKMAKDDGHLRFYVLVFEENFTLGDDLYVKMNARGLALTTFENFKASFEEDILEGDVKKSFKKDIDTTWTNMFWFPLIAILEEEEKKEDKKGRDETPASVDTEMMRFVRMILSFNYANYSDNNDTKTNCNGKIVFDDKIFGSLLVNANRKDFIPDEEQNYAYLTANNILNNDAAKIIVGAFIAMGKLWNENENKWNDDFVKPIGLTQTWNKFITKDKPDYETQLLLLSVILTDSIDNDERKHQWLRLCRNLICNSIINSKNEMRGGVKKIYELKDKQNFGLDKELADTQSLPQYFNMQFKEERIKYNLSNTKEWPEAIAKYEDNDCLIGRILFLLKYCEKTADSYDLKLFKKYAESAIKLLPAKNHQLERLLLNNKNSSYPLQLEDMGLSKQKKEEFNIEKVEQFSFFNKGKENRDFGWHRLLNDDPNEYDKQPARKKGLANCQEACKQIICDDNMNPSTEVQTSSNIDEWKQLLVDCPQLIDYCTGTILYKVTYKADPQGNSRTQYYLSKGGRNSLFNKKNKISELYLRYIYEKLHESNDDDKWEFKTWSYTDGKKSIECSIQYDNNNISIIRNNDKWKFKYCNQEHEYDNIINMIQGLKQVENTIQENEESDR